MALVRRTNLTLKDHDKFSDAWKTILFQRIGSNPGIIKGDLEIYSDIESDEDSKIYYLSNDIDFEHYETFCDDLAPHVKKGSIELENDLGVWIILFDGKGGWESVFGKVFYGFDSYEEFMKEHENDLPKELASKLKSWRVVKKL